MLELTISYTDMSRLLTVLASALLTYGLYHQVWKIFQTKSANDFSLSLIAALLVSETTWLNYGIAIYEWPIIFISGINLPAVVLAAYGFYLYGGIRKTENKVQIFETFKKE